MIKKWNQKNMKECDKRKSDISRKLQMIYISSNNVRHPVTKTFTTLHHYQLPLPQLPHCCCRLSYERWTHKKCWIHSNDPDTLQTSVTCWVSMAESPSWEDGNHLESQKVHFLLQNQKFNKTPVAILSYMTPLHIATTYSLEVLLILSFQTQWTFLSHQSVQPPCSGWEEGMI